MGRALEPLGGPADLSGRASGRGASAARLAAFQVLSDVREGAFADRAAAERLPSLSVRDRRLAMELAYGCVRLRGRLDHELAALSDRPTRRIEPAVLDWLRIGLYQLREMRVPAHAAVHETVEGVRATVGRRATGFVNGVLRAAGRVEDRKALFPRLGDDPEGHLSTWGSHPAWLVRRWLGRWRVGDVARLVELDNTPPDVTARLLDGEGAAVPDPGPEDVTAPGPERDAAVAGPDRGAAAPAPDVEVVAEPLEGWPRMVRLARGDPASLLRSVPAVVQDPAASAVVDYVGCPGPGTFVDLCSAPGGKGVALAHARPRGSGASVAADVDPGRLRSVREAARRTGTDLGLVVMDGRLPAVRGASTVLADVPCTGTGTLRRRPDARWRIDERRLAAMTALQEELVEACAGLVEPGGLLVYATCSLEPEENEDRVREFLDRHGDFAPEPAPAGAGLPPGVLDAEGQLRVLPWRTGTDGSFAARLRRRAA